MNESIARLFFTVMSILLVLAFALLLSSSVLENQNNEVLYLTQKVQDQYFEIQDLKTDLAVCNWELGNTQTIELNAVVYRSMVR